jgi:hypothetical protein
MSKRIQLLFPLEKPEERVKLPPENQKKVITAMATLLLQIVGVEVRKEAEDE